MSDETLTLKWGTVKGWSDLSESSLDILRRFFDGRKSSGAMTDILNERRVGILCELIEQFQGEIWNDWEGKQMTKDEALKYVREYTTRAA